MKVDKIIKTESREAIIIEMVIDDAGLLQSVLIQFAEHLAHTKGHRAKMRRLAMLIDKKL